MTSDRRDQKNANELERAIHARVKKLEDHEREISERARRRALATLPGLGAEYDCPSLSQHGTGFCPDGVI